MTRCELLRADAPGLAALPPDDPRRVAARDHASGCADCARALGEAERLQALVAGAERPPLPEGAFERASRAIVAELRREGRRRAIGSILAACGAVVLLLALARARSAATGDWAKAIVLGALAVGLAAAGRRWSRTVVAAAILLAVADAVVSGRGGPVGAAMGLECLASELAAAAAVVAAVWLAIRGGTTSPARSAVAAAAAAGALAGDAALELTCAAQHATAHLLVFHWGGVLLAAAGASLLGRWRRGGEASAR